MSRIMSDEKSDSSFHGERNDLDSEHVGYFNQKNVVTLRSMREKVNWKTGKSLREFLDQFDFMISEWKDPFPNLRDIFAREEIDRLLIVSAAADYGNRQAYGARKRFVEFVARSGYKDEPEVDENGKPLLHRTTALHSVFRFSRHDFVRDLFDIYNRFDVNYTDHDGLTHFHAACASGHVAVIEKFLELGQDPDCLNATLNFKPPLYLALQWGHRKAVKTLLKNGANSNLVFKGSTPLHAACNKRRDDLAELLLNIDEEVDQVIQIDALDKKGRTPLHWALLNGKKQTTEALLRRGANPNLADAEGLTPLHYICRKGKGHELLEMFFKINEELNKPVQVDIDDKKGRTPFNYALRNCGCKKQIVQLLLRYAAKNGRLNLTCNPGRSTPLHIICLNPADEDSVDLAKIFFEINDEFNQPWQVNATIKDEMGRTAQIWGLSSNVKMAEVLLRNGVDPNLADAAGRTPLHEICQFHSQDKAEQFLKICDEIQLTVDIDARDNEGNTPLHYVMQNHYLLTQETTELLLRRGVDPNSVNAEGMTPLHFICEREIEDDFLETFFKIIDDIQLTVDIDARDNEGNTPLHYVMQNHYLLRKETTELLLRRGADPNSANTKGLTPLHFICQRYDDNDGLVDKFFKIIDDIQLTVQVDARDNEGNTPLHFLMQKNYPLRKETTELLLRRGVDPNSANTKGLTPLHFICQRESDNGFVNTFFEIIDDIQLTVQVDARDNEGNTPLHFLMQKNYPLRKETTELLLRRGVDPNSANTKGLTPLHFICQRKNDDDFLETFFKICDDIQKTVQVDARDNEWNTPLHFLMQNNYFLTIETLELLLRRGADPNSANAEGMTPLHFICQRKEDDGLVEKFFNICEDIQKTVQVDARDKLNRSPLQLAVVHILLNGVKFLLDRGADLSSFVYPTAIYFVEVFNKYPWLDYFYKLRLMSGTLAIVELLEDKGYELDRDASLTIIKVFANYKCHRKSEPMILDVLFERVYHQFNVMVKPSLSLDEVVKLRTEEAEKLLTFEDYYKLARSSSFHYSSDIYLRDACAEHLCEKLSRGVFQRWALDSFSKLTRCRLPILCCEKIIDESFGKEDLWRIYVANCNLSEAEKSDPLMSELLLGSNKISTLKP